MNKMYSYCFFMFFAALFAVLVLTNESRGVHEFVFSPDDGEYVKYKYDIIGNKEIEVKGIFVDAKKEGVWKWYESGLVVKSGSFSAGVEDGYWDYFYHGGKVKQKTLYFNDGFLMAEYEYCKGGGLSKISIYRGEREGEAKYFCSDDLMSEQYRGREIPENSFLKYKVEKKDNKKNGLELGFFSPGKYEYSQEFINGVLNGKYVYYWENGGIKEAGVYKDGIRSGDLVRYHSNGNVSSEIIYGDHSAEENYYYEDGKLKSKATLVLDYELGLDDELGLGKKKYKELRQGRFEEFYSDGNIKTAGYYLYGLKHGYWRTFNNKGKLASEEFFESGMSIGFNIHLYSAVDDHDRESRFERFLLYRKELDDGNTAMVQKVGGQLWGAYEVFHKNGKLRFSVMVNGGRAAGLYQEYYDTGVMSYSANMLAGSRTGEEIIYYPDGNVAQRGSHSSGFMEYPNGASGEWKFYHPNGVLSRKGGFKEGKRVGVWDYYDNLGVLKESRVYVDFDRYRLRYFNYKEHEGLDVYGDDLDYDYFYQKKYRGKIQNSYL